MKFTGHERDLASAGGAGDDLDYMHARHCSPLTARFLSVDPKNRYRPTSKPQLWNRYSYTSGNPLKYVDPAGEDLKIVYDFSSSGLSQKDQHRLQLAVRKVFKKAGVKNIQSYFRGGSIKPTVERPSDRVVHVEVTSKPLEGKATYGSTASTPGDKSKVSTALAPAGEMAAFNFLVNVTAHEIGHASSALPQYSGDAAQVGSLLNPLSVQPVQGSIMETNVDPATLGQVVRYFSDEDAEALRQRLNEAPESN
jgi:RHS repeat-associated protein